jgi:glycosyltransferase involved in cell wall biosynthesis
VKIAHVIGSLGIGGGERVALDLASGQQRDGVEVVAMSLEEPADGPMAAEYGARGVEIVRVPKKPAGVDPSLWWRLSAEFVRRGINIVHTHNPPPLIYGAPASFFARAGCVHTKHGANAMPTKRRVLARAAARFCDAYVAVSQTTAEQATRDRDVAGTKLMTIENGIDLSRFAPLPEARAEARTALGLAADAFVVGTVGRLVREKNQAALVRAMAPLLSETTRLLLVGDGEERAAVERAVAALDNDGGNKARFVSLLGARSDTPRIYAALDVFALSSDSEGLPLVIIEAMASGLPVVSTAVGGIPAVVVEGVTGTLVAAGDVNALSTRLGQLAASPTLGVTWGTEGRRRALLRYSAERMVNDYFAVYERIRRS